MVHMDIMAKLKPVGIMYLDGNYQAALDMLHEIWNEIPFPKTMTSNAYMVIEYGVAISIKANDLDEAKWWGDIAPTFREERPDSGEIELLMGKVAFARNDLDDARQHFLVANEKSEGRAFEGELAEYVELLKLGTHTH